MVLGSVPGTTWLRLATITRAYRIPATGGFESGFVRNDEAQWYQRDNVSVRGGCLDSEARRERITNTNDQAGSTDWRRNRPEAQCSPSSQNTQGEEAFQYGRFEMRGRFKTQAGPWPPWWTVRVAKEWPSCGEIDTMDYYAGSVRANVACGKTIRWSGKWRSEVWNVSTSEDQE